MTDRLDEAKRLHAAATSGERDACADIGNSGMDIIEGTAPDKSKRLPVFHSMIPNAELEALRIDFAEALSLLRCAQSNWAPGCCHQPEWDERRAALLAKHKETK